MPPKIAKFASFGAVGVSAGVVALLALITLGALPSATGGIDGTHWALTLISTAVPALLIVVIHLVFALQLWRVGSRSH